MYAFIQASNRNKYLNAKDSSFLIEWESPTEFVEEPLLTTNSEMPVFENKLFIVIFCIGAFFGIGAYGVDKMELVTIIITAIVAFVVGFVVLYYIGKHRAE